MTAADALGIMKSALRIHSGGLERSVGMTDGGGCRVRIAYTTIEQ